MNKPLLIVLTGPTAAGKSALSIKLAKAINGEIISADSMQVYRGMDIGTAKITQEQMEDIPHFMIDILDFHENFDVFSFKEMAKPVIEDIIARGKTPIIVGGTGFYIQALAYDIEFSDGVDTSLRDRLWDEVKAGGGLKLYERLKEIDPKSADIISPNNSKRLIRALEFYETMGYPISEHNKTQREKESPYDLKYFVLTRDREALYDDINKRVDVMVKEGLIDEVKALKEKGLKEGMTAYKALGYYEIMDYLDGKCTLEEAVDRVKLDTRHFAKRQLTWFRREKTIIWIDKDKYENEEEILNFMMENINE